MIKLLIAFSLFLFLSSQSTFAQQPIDEEKVNKAIALQKKMMQNPGDAMTISAELQALKLNSAESKEVNNRMMKTAKEMIAKGKEQAMAMTGVTEADLKKQKENKERIIPVKDDARINAVLKRPLAEGEVKKFCKAVHEAVKKQMSPALIKQAETFYAKLKSSNSTASSLGNGAIGCYLNNLTQHSIYILGRVCSEENIDANNINNYAALLTNHGVEEGSIPLLNYLHKKYGKDPFVYSNLSIAWMGLGDIKTADKYADSCIRYFPDRSHQAHYVKCIVEETNGNHQAAVEQLQKSTGQVYSAVKEAQLRKWGSKLHSSHRQKKLPPDALGLSKFVFPEFPLTLEAYVSYLPEWAAYYKALQPEIKKLEDIERVLSVEASKEVQRIAVEMMARAKKIGYAFAGDNTNMNWQNYLVELNMEYSEKENVLREELKQIYISIDSLKEEMVKTIEEKDTYECGEGQTCPEEEICNIHLSAYNEYMGKANKMLQEYWTNYMYLKRRATNDLVYVAKYCMPEKTYEHYKIGKQLDFLNAMNIIKYKLPGYQMMFGGFGPACFNVKENPFVAKPLQRFEDIHCPPDWKLEIPGGSGVSTHCTKITLKFGLGVAGGTYTEDLLTGEWTNMTIEIGKEIGSTKIKGIDVSAEAGAYIEIDRQGITDWGVKGSVGADAIGVVEAGSGKIGEGGGGVLQAGGEVKISMMSGKPSFDTKAGLNNKATEIGKIIKSGFDAVVK
jgi:hypothetical protein